MKKLIEKIESCGYDTEYDIPDLGLGFNQGLERAIAILKAELAELPQPTCEGWWLNWNDKVVRHVQIDVVPFYFINGWRENCQVGKWINLSSIIPESEGE